MVQYNTFMSDHDHLLELKKPVLEIPPCLQPGNCQDFPDLLPEDLSLLRGLGWSRVGVVAAIINPAGDILTLENQPDGDKILATQYGVLSETSRIYGTRIEGPAETVARCMKEELGVNPAQITTYVPTKNPYLIHQWPVGGKHKGEYALAICPLIVVGDSSAELLKKPYNNTPPHAKYLPLVSCRQIYCVHYRFAMASPSG